MTGNRKPAVKILLIDQDARSIDILRNVLRRAGYHVFIAVDQDSAMRLAQREQPSLIVMDLLLNGTEGIHLFNHLKQDLLTRKLPILLSTILQVPPSGEIWQPDPHMAPQQLYYEAYLPKPIDIPRFLRVVESLVQPTNVPAVATGPDALVVVVDDQQRQALTAALDQANFAVRAFRGLDRPLSAMQRTQPVALVIDAGLLDEETRQTIRHLRKQVDLGVVVLHPDPPPTRPDTLEDIDLVFSSHVQPWQVVQALQQRTQQRQAGQRLNEMSAQVLYLTTEFAQLRHSYFAQNLELDLVNRNLHAQNMLQNTLTSMIVHDLKAPLGALINTLQLLLIDPGNTLSGGSQHVLKQGGAAGKQMLRLIETLLDERKLRNKEVAFEMEEIEVQDVVGETIDLMQPLFAMHKASVRLDFPDDLPEAKADPLVLQRIIENLIDNALKYSPPQLPITVAAIQQGAMIQLSVIDQGDGISPEQREIIFEPFSQLEDSRLNNFKRGVGLGLAFCKLAVEAMGGQIWVDSPGERGAAFRFTLPANTE